MLIKIRNVPWQAKIKSVGNSKTQTPLEVFLIPKPHVVTFTAVSMSVV